MYSCDNDSLGIDVYFYICYVYVYGPGSASGVESNSHRIFGIGGWFDREYIEYIGKEGVDKEKVMDEKSITFCIYSFANIPRASSGMIKV